MDRYIDAEKLKTEITRLKGQLIRGACASQIVMETNCKDEAYNEVLAIITSLQQEQPEVDLEKEIQKHIKECLDIKFPTTDIELIKKDVAYTARKFYGLGKARKEE